MSARTIEYVSEGDTVADITLKDSTSASLRTTTAILLAVLLISAFILNLMLCTTVLAGKKLRSSIFHCMLCHLSAINILDLGFTLLISLLYVANGIWTFGLGVCRMNAFFQQFCQLYTLLSIMTMAIERAVSLTNQRIPLFSNLRTFGVMTGVFVIALACTIPTVFDAIPVKLYKYRYLCGIDDKCPIAYSLTQVVIYLGSCIVMTICAGSIFARRQHASIPVQSHEYSEFITKTRAQQEGTSLGKLVITLFSLFIILEGPYATLCFVMQISQSVELYDLENRIDVAQDADTLLTWLKFLFPLLCPIFILCWCTEIWHQLLELFCCRSSEPPTIGQFMSNGKNNLGSSQVMTLVATPDGLQLLMPSYNNSHFDSYPASSIYPTPPYNGAVSTEGTPREVLREREGDQASIAPAAGIPISRSFENIRHERPIQSHEPSCSQAPSRLPVPTISHTQSETDLQIDETAITFRSNPLQGPPKRKTKKRTKITKKAVVAKTSTKK